MSDKNLEIGVKATFALVGQDSRAEAPEEERNRDQIFSEVGVEFSGSYNLLGQLRNNDIVTLGPRIDLAWAEITSRRYRSERVEPVKDSRESMRAGITCGVGPESGVGGSVQPVGIRFFLTAGPDVVNMSGTDSRAGRGPEFRVLGIKGGVDGLLAFQMGKGEEAMDVGFVLSLAGIRTANPVTREAESGFEGSFGLVFRF